jgi:putative aldouronate transport system permease protein
MDMKPLGGVQTGNKRVWRRILKKWELYLFLAPAVAYFLIFHYYPIYGLQIAFKNYMVSLGISGSPWIGFDHFERFFQSYFFWTLLKNTLLLQLYQLAMFPLPIILALSINEVNHPRFKKWVQTVTYAPHFISVVVMVGIVITFLNPATGIVNHIIRLFGGEAVAFMIEPGWFKTIYVLSGEWQNLGWGAIIYLAALAAVNPELHEAARVDGATRLQRIWHINLPGILPTIIILFILNIGNLMTVGFEKIYLMQNALNMDTSDIIQTYVYRNGLLEGQYGFTAAIGLFNNLINFFMLVLFNQLLRRTGSSLW